MIVIRFKLLPVFDFMTEISLNILKIRNKMYKYIFLINIVLIYIQFKSFQLKKELFKSIKLLQVV